MTGVFWLQTGVNESFSGHKASRFWRLRCFFSGFQPCSTLQADFRFNVMLRFLPQAAAPLGLCSPAEKVIYKVEEAEQVGFLYLSQV